MKHRHIMRRDVADEMDRQLAVIDEPLRRIYSDYIAKLNFEDPNFSPSRVATAVKRVKEVIDGAAKVMAEGAVAK